MAQTIQEDVPAGADPHKQERRSSDNWVQISNGCRTDSDIYVFPGAARRRYRPSFDVHGTSRWYLRKIDGEAYLKSHRELLQCRL